jgi:hypothetical protein
MTSSILNINSNFQIFSSTSTSSHFDFNIGQALNIKELVIKNITVPNTVYNVNNLNNTFTYIPITPVNIVVPVGNYDITSLMTTLQTLIGGQLISWNLNPTTGKIDLVWSIPVHLPASGIANLIGLRNSLILPYPTTPIASFSLPFVPDMTAVRNFYICSRTLAQGVNSILVQGTNLPIIAIVPNTVPFGGINHYVGSDSLLELKIYTAQQNLQYIDIQIRDDNGRIVDLNGSSFQMNCLIYKNATSLYEK